MSDTVVSGNTRSNLKTSWLFAVLWNLISAPLVVIVPREFERNSLAAIGLLFPVIGVGLLTWAVMTTLRWRRFGPSSFNMSAATVGGQCVGTIQTRFATDEARSIRVTLTLTCLDRVTTGRGKHRNTRENILWREEYTVPEGQIGIGAFGSTIPVRFALPTDAPETTAVGRSDGIVWALAAEASLPGVDFKEDFDVPVSRAAGETRLEPGSANAFTPPREPISPTELAVSGVHIKTTSEGAEYYFAPARNASFAGGLTVFTFIWTGALWLQVVLDIPLIFVVVTGLFEVLLLFIVLRAWFGSTTVTIGTGRVRRATSLFGLGTARDIASQSVRKLDLHISMQSTGRSGVPYYELRATLDTGRHMDLGSGIRNKRHAEWLVERVRSEIGLKS